MKKLFNKDLAIQCPEFQLNFIQEEPNLVQELDQNWAGIQQFLLNLYQGEAQINFEVPYQEIYLLVEDLCQYSLQEQLNKKLKEFMQEYFSQILTNLQSKAIESLDFLDQIQNMWVQIKRSSEILTPVFKYFETTYLVKTRTQTFQGFVLLEFSRQFSKFQQISFLASQQILEIIQNKRQNQEINENQLQLITEMFIALELYDSIFEKNFLVQTEQYFSNISTSLNEQFEVKSFIEQVEFIENQEKQLVEKFLSKQTGKKVINSFEQQLILKNLPQIYQSFSSLLVDKEYKSLQVLYKILSQVEKIQEFKETWKKAIKDLGLEIINIDEKNQIAQKLLDFIKNLDKVMYESFSNNKILLNNQKFAIHDILNKKSNQLAELICKHIDNKLVKTNKQMSQEEKIIQDLEEALLLFRHLPSKDVFEGFYNRRFAKRMLMDNSYSSELEEHVIQKLKQECGETYTKIVEDIIQDLKTSKEINADFTSKLQEQGILNNPLNVHVISGSSWPSENQPVPNFHEPFLSLKNQFEDYYKQKNESVTLFWQYTLSSVELEARFDKRYIFCVSLQQAVILNCFNEKEQWSYPELGDYLQMDKEILKNNIVSLYCMKYPILKKSKTSDGKSIAIDDIFIVNDEFKYNKIKVKVNTVQIKESEEEKDKIMKRVLEDRQYVVDACIVKIMKLKKTLSHQELSQEIISDLKLPLEKSVIKTRIESLIERDYLKRDPQQNNKYIYLA